MKIYYKQLVCVTVALLSASCASVHKIPAGVEAMPAHFSQEIQMNSIIGADKFISPQLNDILIQTVSDNLDIAQASARLDKANSLTVIARSKRIPTLDLSARADLIYNDGKKTKDDLFGGVVSSYELDLWGKVRASHLSSKMNSFKVAQDLKTIYVSTSSSVAKTYFELQARIKITDILKEQLSINSQYLKVMEERFFAGMASSLDLLQQKQAVAKIESAIPLSLRQEELLRHTLSVLVGFHASDNLHVMPEESLPADITLCDTGVPLALLHNRPDVKSAYYELQKYLWELSSARLSRLPSITINPSGGFAFDDLNNFLATVTANAVLPFFRSGAKNAEIKIAKANVKEYTAAYRKAIINAVKDTEDVIVKINTQKDYLNALGAEFEFAKRTYLEAKNHYLNGSVDYSVVVGKLLTMQNLEQTLISAKKDLCLFYVDFYRSVGVFLSDDLASAWELKKGMKNE